VFIGEVTVEVLRGGRNAGLVVSAVGAIVGSFVLVHERRVLAELA